MRRNHSYEKTCKQMKCMADGGRVRKKRKYGDGGKVEGKKAAPPVRVPSTPPKPDPEMLGSGEAAKAGDILRNRRKQQMKELGI